MNTPEASVLRILRGRSAVGAGFLATEGLAVTCAHVLQASGGDLEGSVIEFDFPLIAPGKIVFGRVVFLDTDKDIAVVEITDKLPKGAGSVRMVTAEDLWEHKFRAFGFPAGYDNGVWASGVLRGRTADGWLHVEDIKETGFRVQPGFSGGPIWDEQLQAMIGMVVAAEKDPSLKAAFCIPTSVLVSVYPGLKEHTIPACPYRGLYAFREQDAALFFGRESFTDRLKEAVQSRALVAVVGASGNGKSSVVFAGLLPKLRSDAKWLIADFRPGPRPFEALAAGLLLLLEPSMTETDRLIETRKLASALQARDLQLIEVVDRLLAKHDKAHKLLLIGDQFEELYTLCEDTELRRHFLDVLLEGLNSQSKIKVTCLITLRADFMGQALTYRTFADALQDTDLKLGPMTPEELEHAIKKPAELLGVEFESGLPALIVDQIEDQPAALPLLQFALTQLWDRQENGLLKLKAYQDIGGVEEALALYADQVYDSLSNDKKEQARRIFIQLVSPGMGTEDTRRLAVRTDLEAGDWELVRQLASLRLVVTDRTPDAQETVEVVHEALIREWAQLRSWMQADRVFRGWQERLRSAMRQWHASEKDEGALLRGAPLAEAEGWLERRNIDISPAEEDFINSSVALREHRQKEETERQRRELEAARKLAEVESHSARRARRFIRLLVGIALVAISALALSLFFYTTLEARRLAAVGSAALADDRPQWAAILGMQSLQIADTPDGQDVVGEASMQLSGHYLYKGFIGHSQRVKSVAWSPDGRRLASGSQDGTVIIWDAVSFLERGKPAKMLEGHPDAVTSVAWSPDGQLASASDDGTVKIWDLESGEPLQTLDGHSEPVNSIAWSSDGRLASGSGDKTVILWNIESGKPAQTLKGHSKPVNSVAWSSDGRLASGSEDDTVIIWDLESGIPSQILEADAGPVLSVAWSPDGRLASGADDRTVIIWDLEDEEPLQILKAHLAGVNSVAWSSEGQLASTSDDHTVIIWDLENERPAQMLDGPSTALLSVAWSPDGRLASGAQDSTVVIWDLDGGHPLQTLKGPLTEEGEVVEVTSVAWSTDGRLASGSDDGIVTVWDLASGKPIPMNEGHDDSVSSLAWFSGERLASGSDDGTIIIWDLESGEALQTLTEEEEEVTSVAWSPYGQLASGLKNGTVVIWDLESGEPAQILEGGHAETVTSIAWSPNGQLASGSHDGKVIIWDLETAKPAQTLEGHLDRIFTVAWSSDGRLASASRNGTVIIWDLQSGKPLRPLNEHSNRVNSLAWSADGRLASGSGDTTVIVWNLESRKPEQKFKGNPVVSVAWSPDGRLAFASDDGTVNVAKAKLTRSPCEWMSRNMSLSEWKEKLGYLYIYRPACPRLPSQPITAFSTEYYEFTEQGRILVLLALLIILAILIGITQLVFRMSRRAVLRKVG